MGLDTIKVGFVYNIVLYRKSVIGADRSWDRANGQDLPQNYTNCGYSETLVPTQILAEERACD